MQHEEKKLYYNRLEFDKIIKISKIDPKTAISLFKKYIEDYSYDYSSITYYIFELITICEFVEADDEIKELESRFKKGLLYKDDSKRSMLLEHDIKLCKLKLYLNAGLMKKAVELYSDNYNEFSCLNNKVKFYMKKLRGELDLNRRSPNSYEFRQIVKYDELDFKNNLKICQYNSNESDEEIKPKHFNHDFPLDDVIKEVKKKMSIDNRLCHGYVDNMYVFKYDHCGRDGNKSVDYFKVTTLCYSTDIIAMYPSSGCEFLPYVDLNYLKEKEESRSLIKRPSQIDKFRQRYYSK